MYSLKPYNYFNWIFSKDYTISINICSKLGNKYPYLTLKRSFDFSMLSNYQIRSAVWFRGRPQCWGSWVFGLTTRSIPLSLCCVWKRIAPRNSINQSMLSHRNDKVKPNFDNDRLTVLSHNLSVMIFLQQLKFATKPNMYIIYKKIKETSNEFFMQGNICMS